MTAASGSARSLVVFDLDGTLTRRDTLMPFLQRVVGRGPTCRALVAESLALARTLGGGARRDAAKAALLGRLLAGRPVESLLGPAEAFAGEVVERRLRPGMAELVSWHRRAGHRLVIVSASPEVYVAPVGRRLGFDTVLATRLEVGLAGRLTGRLEGPNCRGPEKVARLREWLGGEPLVAFAYGDSRGDRELLALAETGVRVGGHPRWPPGGFGGRSRGRSDL